MKHVLCLALLFVPSTLAQTQYVPLPSEIVVLTIGATVFERLTNNDFADEEPEWSPDGTRIFFDSDRAGTNDLYFMLADGSGLMRLTDGGPRRKVTARGHLTAAESPISMSSMTTRTST